MNVDGILYFTMGILGAIQLSLGTGDAAKYIRPDILFYLQAMCGATITGFNSWKAWRSNSRYSNGNGGTPTPTQSPTPDQGPTIGTIVKKASIIFLLVSLTGLIGCAMTRPHVVETVTSTNGVVTKRELSLPAFVVWPATQTLEKQRGSIGKTLSAGFTSTEQDGGGTNIIELLKQVNQLVSQMPK